VRAYRTLSIGLALAVTATVGIDRIPILEAAASAASPSAYDSRAQQQLRHDECLLSNILRLGGPTMKQVAGAGLAGDAAALHAAADPSYWDSTPLSVAYQTDHDAELAKLDQLGTIHTNRAIVNGTLSLGTLATPQVIPFGPADPWNAINPEVSDPFSKVGLSKWVAQNFWTSQGTFYEDPTPLASEDSVTALTALGSRYVEPEGTDPNFQQDLREYLAWRDMTFMHDYYADDARIVLESGGFARSAPAPGSVEFRVAVEQLKSRFASCGSDDPQDPNGVLGAEVQAADAEWHAEIAGQKTQRAALYAASAKTEAALSAGSEALGRVLLAAEQANLLTYYNAYWLPGGPGVVGTGPITFKLSGATSLCLNNKGNTSTNGAAIEAYACSSTVAQQWKPYTGSTLDGELQNPNGKCMQAAGTTVGSKVQLYTCNGSATEHWRYVTTKGVTRLYNVGAKLCLGFPTATTGQVATVRTCDGSTSQRFAVSQDNSSTLNGDKSQSYPTAAEFTKVSQALTTLRSTAAAQYQIVQQQAAIAQQQATATTAAQQQAYAIADAAGAPRGRGLLSGQQEAQVVLASSSALTALSHAAATANQATAASVADSQTLTAAAVTQAAAGRTAFNLAAAQEADAQAKAEAAGAALQAQNAAAEAGKAKQALATAQAAEATAKQAAATAHAKRLAAEAEQRTAAKEKANAAAYEAQAARERAAAEQDDQAARAALANAQSAQATAEQKSAAAQDADRAATRATQAAWDAQARFNALDAKAQAADAHADAEESRGDATESRAAANDADAAADAAEADATAAQQHADAASAAAAAADAAATRAEAAASRAQSDADAAEAAKATAEAALRTSEAAAAVAVHAAQQASSDAAAAQRNAAAAEVDAKAAQQAALDAARNAQEAQVGAATTAGFAYTTAQAAAAASAAAEQVTTPANDAIQLGAPYVDHDSSAGLAVLSAQAAKSIAEQQAAAAQAKAQQAAQAAQDAQDLAATATGDAKAAAVVAADAAVQAANAAVSAQHALASAAEAQKYAAQALASVAQTKAYVAQATADSAAAQVAADTAAGDAADARASATSAEQDAAAAQQAAADAHEAATRARQAAAAADAAAAAAEAAAEHAEAQAASAQQAATLAQQQQNANSVTSGGATGTPGLYTTQTITPIGDPKPQNPCDLPTINSVCHVRFLLKFTVTVDFYLCDDTSLSAAELNAGGCPAVDAVFLGSETETGEQTIERSFTQLDIALMVDKAFLTGLWNALRKDFVDCSHGSVSGCLWAASWFVPESKILQVIDAIKALNLSLHTGVGIGDAWRVVEGLRLDVKVVDALRVEVEIDQAILADCRINSFLPGTQVLMGDGSYRALSSVRIGDRVMSADPATGDRRPSTVTDTFAHPANGRLLTLALAGGGLLTTTPGHRILVAGRGWVLASDLHTGDRLGVGGDPDQVLVAVTRTVGGGRTVGDLTVALTHDFFVRAGSAAVLVHNCTNLAADERLLPNMAHTLADHVNITPAAAAAKAAEETLKQGKPISTSVWASQDLAQEAVDQAITRAVKKDPKVFVTWFTKIGKGKAKDTMTLTGTLPGRGSLGTVYEANGSHAAASNSFTVVLKRLKGHDPGFIVYTSYPNPVKP
jgi:hypothetical protein